MTKVVKIEISSEDLNFIRMAFNKLVTHCWAEKGQIKDKICDLKTPQEDKVKLHDMLRLVNNRLENVLELQSRISHTAWKQGEDI